MTFDRPVPSDTVESWIFHLRRQRSRALDAIWLIENGATLHDGRHGIPTADATARFLSEYKEVVGDVNALLGLYENINA